MKRAWEYTHEAIRDAVPRLQSEEEAEWTEEKLDIGALDIEETRKRWSIPVPGSLAPDYVLLGGIQAVSNMGYDVSEAEAMIPELQRAYDEHDDIVLLRLVPKLYAVLHTAPKIPDHPYWSYRYYENFEDHLKDVRFPAAQEIALSDAAWREKMHAGWQAQIAGAAVGTIIEGYSAAQLKKAFGEIRGYLRTPTTYNDDVLFEIAFLEAFSHKGYDVTSEDIALEWASRIEYAWSAEEVAFKNIKRGVMPPLSATLCNPWREWIGAQMRGSICGLVAPGDPETAAKLAWTDGTVSHVNNGVLGEVFNALLCSLAFIKEDVRDILVTAMDLIPKKSEYYSVLSFAYDACEKTGNWEEAWALCEERYKQYNWIHAYPNAAAEVVSLYFGGQSFDECMYICAMCGQDVDCNAGQIGTIYGIIHGYEGIDNRWTEPFGDRFDSLVRGYEHTTVTALADLTYESMKKARG